MRNANLATRLAKMSHLLDILCQARLLSILSVTRVTILSAFFPIDCPPHLIVLVEGGGFKMRCKPHSLHSHPPKRFCLGTIYSVSS